MKRPLLIACFATLVCGANAALATTTPSAAPLECPKQECDDDGDLEICAELGCDGCTEFPVGKRCYNN